MQNLPCKKHVITLLIYFCLFGLVALFGCSESNPTSKAIKYDKKVKPVSSDFVYKFTSDTSFYFSTSHEGKFVANTDYLKKQNLENIPFSLGEWKGENIETDDKNILYFRFYENPKNEQAVYFVAAHGTNESLFHTPEVCYIGDGWKIEERSYKSLKIREENFQVRYAIAKKDNFAHLILYWYMWPNSRHNIMDGMTMLRMSVRIDPSIEEAEKTAIAFIKELSNLKMDTQKVDQVAKFAPQLPKVIKQAKFSGTTQWSPYKQKAIDWLKAQSVPNAIVPEPVQDRRNLLISYRVPQDAEAYRYVFSKASIYDNALAIIAFSMVGEYSLAEKVIEAASRVLSRDGDLWFTFNTHNSWPNENDHGGAINRSGASAWLGYAITYYLKSRLVDNPSLLQQDHVAINFIKIAQSIADKILLRQITNRKDPRYGLFTGGEGSYIYKKNVETNNLEEVFAPGSIQWASMEHNIDIYFFLRDLARLTGSKKFNSSANLLKQSISEKSWNEQIGQLNRGHRLDGPDSAKALDCSSWGAMFLLAIGENKKAKIALESSSKYQVNLNGYIGYKPYIDLPLYEEPEINSLFFPEDPGKNWNELPMIWPEGSLGVAMAQIKIGDKVKAEQILKSMIHLQDSEGGLPYATENLKFQFSKNPSVAGTAWLVMAISAIEDDNIKNLFWEK